MTNVKSFDVNDTVEQIVDYAPLILFVMMSCMFFLTGLMQYLFLSGILSLKNTTISYVVFFFPIVIQVLRFVTGFLSASFFKKGRWFFGLFVFVFSIWLSLHEYSEVVLMSTYWSNVEIDLNAILANDMTMEITDKSIKGMMTVLIWGALVLEFFLAAWLGSSKSNQSVPFSSNGVHKKHSKALS